jgi:putative tricarboxylic transport membrane protein
VTAKDIMTALLLMGLAGFGWQQTQGLSAEAAMFPRLALGTLAALSAAYLLRTLVYAGIGLGNSKKEARELKEEESFFVNPYRFFVCLTLIIAYIAVFPTIGYFTATLIFIPLFVFGIGAGRPVAAIASSLGFVVFTYIVFVVLLRRHLPNDFIIDLLL